MSAPNLSLEARRSLFHMTGHCGGRRGSACCTWPAAVLRGIRAELSGRGLAFYDWQSGNGHPTDKGRALASELASRRAHSSVIASVAFGLADSFGGHFDRVEEEHVTRCFRARIGRAPSSEERGAAWDLLFAIEAGEV